MTHVLAGQVVRASDQNNFQPITTIKAADESVTSSTTLQNDDELSATIPAVGTYVFDLFIYATSAANAAGDIKIGFTFPTGSLRFSGIGPDVGLASGSVQAGQWFVHLSAASGTSAINFGLSTATVGIRIHGLFVASATGTLQVQWAQDSSNANASTVKAGSHLVVQRVS